MSASAMKSKAIVSTYAAVAMPAIGCGLSPPRVHARSRLAGRADVRAGAFVVKGSVTVSLSRVFSWPMLSWPLARSAAVSIDVSRISAAVPLASAVGCSFTRSWPSQELTPRFNCAPEFTSSFGAMGSATHRPICRRIICSTIAVCNRIVS